MLSKNYPSPLRLIITIAVTIVLAESLVMIFLWVFPQSSPLIEGLIDSTLLVGLISPALYLYVFRPFVRRDIERQCVEDRLNYLAYYDDLTGLPNSTLFHDRLSQALSLAKRDGHQIAVLFFNLDRLKLINDSLGRHIGDLLLRAVGERLTHHLRESDSVVHWGKEAPSETVARFGGDEFIVLLPRIEKAEDAAIIARRILDMMSQPLPAENQDLLISSSIGVSVYPADGDSPEALVRNAGAAMYRIKEEGGNNFRFYSADINAKTLERLTMATHLHQALEQSQFRLYYQPQVDLKTGQITGVEALIRWQHPERGMVSPAQFIPLAEETGLIVPIGKWVLQTAFAQNKAWQNAGLPLITMAVNLSARQFQEKGLVETVEQAIVETGIDPCFVELELTESIMQNTEKTIEILNKFRAMGVKVSIDDFGTGYSSLSYLKRFPINKLKIDQSFVRESSSNPDDAAIVRAIITLAHTLKLEVIAEGVETEAQCEFLRAQDCDEIQGYLFSKPLPAGEATILLGKKKSLFLGFGLSKQKGH